MVCSKAFLAQFSYGILAKNKLQSRGAQWMNSSYRQSLPCVAGCSACVCMCACVVVWTKVLHTLQLVNWHRASTKSFTRWICLLSRDSRGRGKLCKQTAHTTSLYRLRDVTVIYHKHTWCNGRWTYKIHYIIIPLGAPGKQRDTQRTPVEIEQMVAHIWLIW